MIIAMLFLFFLSTIILVTKAKNRYTISFAIAFLSIIILSVALIIYTFKLSEFKYLLPFEYHIYYFFRYVKINYFEMREIINFGVIIFLTAMYSFSCFKSNKHKPYIHIIPFMVTFILYYILNSSIVYEYIYLFSNSKSRELIILSIVLKTVISGYNYILIFIVCLNPYIQLIKEYRDTKILFRKRHIIITIFSLITVQIIFFAVLSTKIVALFFNNFNIHSINLSGGSASEIYIYLPFLIIILSTVLCIVLFKFKVLDETSFFKKRAAIKKSKILTSDIRHIFHSYKNALMSISTLCDSALEDFGSKKSEEYILKIKSNTDDFAEHAKRFLDVYNKPKLNLQTIDIITCLNYTVKQTPVCKNISIIKNYETYSANVFADFEKLSEMFRNIIKNAEESIVKRNIPDGCIKINVWKETKWVCVSIIDNGCGIDKKMQKNMFKPFYTSKNTFKNWGIGMSYVQKTVEAHLGFIEVQSKINNFTEIQIILPNDENGADDIEF